MIEILEKAVAVWESQRQKDLTKFERKIALPRVSPNPAKHIHMTLMTNQENPTPIPKKERLTNK